MCPAWSPAGDVFEFVARDHTGQPHSVAQALAAGATLYALPGAVVAAVVATRPAVLAALLDETRAQLVQAYARVEEPALYPIRVRVARTRSRNAPD